MNVIFDGNYLCHSRYAVIHNYLENQEGRTLSKTEVLKEVENQARFFRKLITDFCSVVRLFNEINRVVLVFDSPTWRKSILSEYKDKSPKNELEAMMQKENEEGNKVFQTVLEKFAKHMKSKGFIVMFKETMEGDDLCYVWSSYFNSINEDCVIISGDKDLLQVLNKKTAVYRNNSMAPAFFYNDSNSMREIGEQIKETVKKLKVEEIDPIKHLYQKLLLGDSGDNVSNLFKGLGEKTAEKIISLLESESVLSNELTSADLLYDIVDAVILVTKTKIDPQELIGKLLTNIQLMWLDERVYPNREIFEEVKMEVEQLQNEYSFEGEFSLEYILQK